MDACGVAKVVRASMESAQGDNPCGRLVYYAKAFSRGETP